MATPALPSSCTMKDKLRVAQKEKTPVNTLQGDRWVLSKMQCCCQRKARLAHLKRLCPNNTES